MLSSPIATTNHLPAITWSDPSQEMPHAALSQETPLDVPVRCHSPVTSTRTPVNHLSPANHLIRLRCINSANLCKYTSFDTWSYICILFLEGSQRVTTRISKKESEQCLLVLSLEVWEQKSWALHVRVILTANEWNGRSCLTHSENKL